jgi:hypothetical protein
MIGARAGGGRPLTADALKRQIATLKGQLEAIAQDAVRWGVKGDALTDDAVSDLYRCVRNRRRGGALLRGGVSLACHARGRGGACEPAGAAAVDPSSRTLRM